MWRTPSRFDRAAAAGALIVLSGAGEAEAHASDRGFVLLLPTGHYIVGGAAAVAATFLVLLLVPPGALRRAASWRLRLPVPRTGRRLLSFTSLAGFLLLAALVAAGFLGSRDPLSNPLPLVVWTLLWVGLVLVQGAVGDLWRWIDPWHAPWRLLSALAARLGWHPKPQAIAALGRWPAVVLLVAFLWFELIDPAPDDPARLAIAVLAYWCLTLAAMLAFGDRAWGRQGEFLGIFLGMIARLAPFSAYGRPSLRLPGARLLSAAPLSPAGTLFLLAALGSVSFDGFSRTFFWLGAVGVNPLEFPGRSAVMAVNSAGLLGMILLLALAFHLAVWLGERLAGGGESHARAAGLLVWSILPIALAYHFSHYLTALLVNGQYALAALSDPFARGWDLFGTAGMAVQAGIVAGSDGAWLVWNLQAAAIVAGHVLAVLIAHMLAFRLHPEPGRAALAELPLALLMVLYTVFGLWLLSTPTGA